MDPEEGDFETLKESPGTINDTSSETPSEVANSKFKLWGNADGKIVKTTDVRVSRDQSALGVPGLSPPEVHGPYNALDMETSRAVHM